MPDRKAFLKELIHVGKFGKDAENVKYDATPEKLETLARNSTQILAAGDKIEVVVDHKKKKGEKKMLAESVRGYLTSVYLKGTKMLGVLQMLGKRGIELAEDGCQTVSLGINQYHPLGEVIDHVSISPKPEVFPQGEFIPLARLDTDAGTTAGMVYLSKENNAMDRKTLAEKLGIEADEVTDDMILAEITKLQGESATQLSRIKELQKTKSTLDPEVIETRVENGQVKLDRLVDDSILTPYVAKAIGGILMGTPTGPAIVCLDRDSTKAAGTSIMERIIAALEQNDPVILGAQKTGKQKTVKLSRDEQKEFSKEANEEMAKM